MFTYQLLSGVYDSKDMLRDNKGNRMVETDFLGWKADLALIQDVQQHVTSREKIFSMMRNTSVLALIFHVEQGEMGFNGHNGFYVREGGCVVNWASIDDAPYRDTEDFVWLFESSAAVYENIPITWCVQNVYANAYFCIFARNWTVGRLPGVVLYNEFQRVRFEVTNRPETWVHWRFVQDTYESYFPYKAQYADVIVFMPFAMLGQQYLCGVSTGVSADKRLDKYMSDLFAEDERMKVLQRHRPNLYLSLVTNTVAYARRLDAERLYETTYLSMGVSGRIATANRWRALVGVDAGFARRCCGCSASSCSAMLNPSCWKGVFCFFCGLWSEVENSQIRITSCNLQETAWHPEFDNAVLRKADLGVCDLPMGVYKLPIKFLSKRWETQTPLPKNFRGVKDVTKVELWIGKKKVAYPFDEILMEQVPLKKVVTYYGPFMVPWHANQESAGGAIGMLNALMTPVVNTEGEEATVEENAAASGWSLQLVPLKGFFQAVSFTEQDQRSWCDAHVKKAIYTPALERALKAEKRCSAYKCSMIAKTNELLLKDKERIILAPPVEFVAYWGYEASVMNARLKEEFGLENFWYERRCGEKAVGHVIWGSGTSPEERGAFFDEALTIPPNHFAFTACGDDMLALVNLEGRVIAVECDASNWDHAQVALEIEDDMAGALVTQSRYYKKMGVNPELVDELMYSGSTITWKNHATSSLINVVLGYSRRMTGNLDTTDGNTINTIHLYWHLLSKAINLGVSADEMEVFIRATGWEDFRVKIKTKVLDDPREATFLKGFYVDCEVGDKRMSIWHPSPEILVKLGASESDPMMNANYRKLCKTHGLPLEAARAMRVYDIVNSWTSFHPMPVLDGLVLMIPPVIRTSRAESIKRVADLDKWDKPQLGKMDIKSKDFSPMLRVLGIEHQLESFNQLCARTTWAPGMFVAHPLVGILAQRYT